MKKKFCNEIISSKDTKTLRFNQYQKFDKVPFVIYVDLECIIKKNDGCKNNPENSSTTKVSKHIGLGFATLLISSFRSIGNMHDVYRGKDCMEKYCKLSKDHAMKLINFKEKKLKLLTKEQQESVEK